MPTVLTGSIAGPSLTAGGLTSDPTFTPTFVVVTLKDAAGNPVLVNKTRRTDITGDGMIIDLTKSVAAPGVALETVLQDNMELSPVLKATDDNGNFDGETVLTDKFVVTPKDRVAIMANQPPPSTVRPGGQPDTGQAERERTEREARERRQRAETRDRERAERERAERERMERERVEREKREREAKEKREQEAKERRDAREREQSVLKDLQKTSEAGNRLTEKLLAELQRQNGTASTAGTVTTGTVTTTGANSGQTVVAPQVIKVKGHKMTSRMILIILVIVAILLGMIGVGFVFLAARSGIVVKTLSMADAPKVDSGNAKTQGTSDTGSGTETKSGNQGAVDKTGPKKSNRREVHYRDVAEAETSPKAEAKPDVKVAKDEPKMTEINTVGGTFPSEPRPQTVVRDDRQAAIRSARLSRSSLQQGLPVVYGAYDTSIPLGNTIGGVHVNYQTGYTRTGYSCPPQIPVVEIREPHGTRTSLAANGRFDISADLARNKSQFPVVATFDARGNNKGGRWH